MAAQLAAGVGVLRGPSNHQRKCPRTAHLVAQQQETSGRSAVVEKMRMIILGAVASVAASCAPCVNATPLEAADVASTTVEVPALIEGGHVKIVVRDAPTDDLNERLTFRVFENGANDLVYVGVKYGMWSRGEFDLRLFEKLIYTGRIEYLLNEDALINMGDVLRRQPKGSLRVTRVTGWFK